MDIKHILEWLSAIIISVGGSSIVIVAIAKWFGDRLANKLLEEDKAKYQEDLEIIKSKFNVELEFQKSNFEKANSLFFRYSEHQFNLYNELWRSLCDLEQVGNELWEQADLQKVKKFSKQLHSTKLSVNKSALLIEENHYRELLSVLERFENLELGKMKLITLRNSQAHELVRISNNEIDYVIQSNKDTKGEFKDKMNQLIDPFKKQIKGE